MKINTTIYAAFCGCGKSYLSSNFSDDCEEIECWEYRQGDFPNNYVTDILRLIGRKKYLFISTDPVILKELNKHNVKIRLCYPSNELRNEYLQRYIDRDSSPDFIGTFMKYWDQWINELKEQDYCEHIVLESGQYLYDILYKKATK